MTPAIRQKLDGAAHWYNERPLRERALVLVTSLVLILFIGWELAAAPIMAKNEQSRNHLASLSSNRQQLLEQQRSLNRQLSTDPSQQLQERLAARKDRLERLDREISETTGRLIPPREMVSLLRDILAAQGKLELLAVELKEPEPIYGDEKPINGDEGDEEGNREPLLYAHEVELAIQGSYLNVLDYLKRLEAMDERLGWVRLQYDADDFPRNEARIRVRTLSLDRAWLGV